MSKKMIRCKVCKQSIAKKAKFCPNCGAKNKKPIFKKWWFWFVIVIILFIAIGSSGGETEEYVDVSGSIVEGVGSSVNNENADAEKENLQQTEATGNAESEENKQELTMGQINALASAESYLAFSAFSYEGLIEQLEYEQYTHEDAVFAADNCGADWNKQALKSAESYLDFSAFSYNGLIEQLEYEKFTTEQATYAADNCGADWNEQAAKSAESYLDFSSFSRGELIDQLEYEGFTREQAEYGVSQNGY